MTLYWTRSRINRSDAMWHIGRTSDELREGRFLITTARLCQPSDQFWGIVWSLKAARYGGSPEQHPMHPASQVRTCPTCLRRVEDTATVLPTLPTPDDHAQARYDDAIGFLSGAPYGHSEYENVGAFTLKRQAEKIAGVDPDLAADLTRLADDYFKALELLLGPVRQAHIEKLRARA